MQGYAGDDQGDTEDFQHREAAASSIREAEEDAAEILTAPVSSALVMHWRSLGSRLLNPL